MVQGRLTAGLLLVACAGLLLAACAGLRERFEAPAAGEAAPPEVAAPAPAPAAPPAAVPPAASPGASAPRVTNVPALLRAAEAGDPKAQFDLADRYLDGRGVVAHARPRRR